VRHILSVRSFFARTGERNPYRRTDAADTGDWTNASTRTTSMRNERSSRRLSRQRKPEVVSEYRKPLRMSVMLYQKFTGQS